MAGVTTYEAPRCADVARAFPGAEGSNHNHLRRCGAPAQTCSTTLLGVHRFGGLRVVGSDLDDEEGQVVGQVAAVERAGGVQELGRDIVHRPVGVAAEDCCHSFVPEQVPVPPGLDQAVRERAQEVTGREEDAAVVQVGLVEEAKRRT